MFDFKGFSWTKKHIISIRDFTMTELLYVIYKAKSFDNRIYAENCKKILEDKMMASLFWEPSTRTRSSFIEAMKELGGQINGFSTGGSSSHTKGETVYDTIKMVEAWADVIVMRHYIEGSARLASEVTNVPVINGGDGANEHPTQTLLDLYTIVKEKGKLTGLKIGLVGDLKYGRTVHSLTVAMSLFDPTFYFISPESLAMPNDYTDELNDKGLVYHVTDDLAKYLNELDVLYVTRVQKERFADEIEYEKIKNYFELEASMLKNVKPDLIILHPLPRVNEIKRDVDDTPYAKYFSQAANGIPVRKAILSLVTGVMS